MNKPLCTYPWAHQEIETNGDIKFCCATSNNKEHAHLDEHGNHYNIHTHTLDEAWNSKRMLKLRENLYNGVKAPECQQCWDNEDRGMWSVRQAALSAEYSYPHIQNIVNESLKNNFILDNNYPYFYQIQSGNTCNLACKICNSDYSITYGRFFNKLGIDDLSQFKYDLSESGKPDNEYAGDHARTSKNLKKHSWPSKIGLTNIIGEEKISNITRLFLSGGEPTIILENLKFLEYLYEHGYSKNIDLVIVTNTTMIHPRFIESIKHFKHVDLILSIDSVGPAIELQRYPVKWAKLEKNIDQYIDLSLKYNHVNVGFNVVITALTLPYLNELLSFIDLKNKNSKRKIISIAALVQMSSGNDFNLEIVPYDVAQKCREKIESTLDYMVGLHDQDLIQVKDLLKSLERFTFNKENNYTKIQNALEILQQHHPEYNVREIYKIYY